METFRTKNDTKLLVSLVKIFKDAINRDYQTLFLMIFCGLEDPQIILKYIPHKKCKMSFIPNFLLENLLHSQKTEKKKEECTLLILLLSHTFYTFLKNYVVGICYLSLQKTNI